MVTERQMARAEVTFQDRLAVIRIPDGFEAGDLMVMEITGDRVLIQADVLERLVRAYHVLDEGPTDETGEPVTGFAACSCGWSTVDKDRGSRCGQHETHVRFEVLQALDGRATA